MALEFVPSAFTEPSMTTSPLIVPARSDWIAAPLSPVSEIVPVLIRPPGSAVPFRLPESSGASMEMAEEVCPWMVMVPVFSISPTYVGPSTRIP